MTKYAVFGMGDEVFGIEIERVVEILKSRKTYALPELPEFLSGVITVEGDLVLRPHSKKNGSCSFDMITRRSGSLLTK